MNYQEIFTQTIAPSDYFDFVYTVNVPNGYRLVDVRLIHSGSHMATCFGIDFMSDTGTVDIYTRITNLANYELNIAPILKLIFIKIK